MNTNFALILRVLSIIKAVSSKQYFIEFGMESICPRLSLNGESGNGNGERGTGNGERGTGNGERGTGNGERGTRNL